MLSTAFLVAVVMLLIFLWTERARPVPGLPVVQPFHFWIGNLLEFVNSNKHLDRTVKLWKQLGPGCYTAALPMRHGAGSVMLAPDEKLSEYVHKTNWKNYNKGELLVDFFKEFFGDGIFAVNGEKWRHQRKTASHIFSQRFLQDDMAPVFAQHAETVMEILSKTAENKETINISDLFFRYTINTFAEIGFGEDLNALRKDPNEIAFARAFDEAQILMSHRGLDPFYKLKRYINRFVPIFRTEATIKKNLDIVDEFAYRVIAERKKEGAMGKDLVSRFMAAAKANGEVATDVFLRDIVLNFLIAGRDTTAIAMGWMSYVLCTHPEIQEKVYEEVVRVCGTDKITYENAQDLKYTEAVFMETLRLYPSVPSDFKTAVKDDVLPNGVKIPAGTIIVYSPYLYARAPQLWGEDCEKVVPERWFGEEGKHSQYKYITFNAGPRLCLGKHVAILEGKLLMANIVRGFRMSLKEGQEVTYTRSITLPIKGGLFVNLESRAK